MGAATEAELEDRKLRIEDAKNATFAVSSQRKSMYREYARRPRSLWVTNEQRLTPYVRAVRLRHSELLTECRRRTQALEDEGRAHGGDGALLRLASPHPNTHMPRAPILS